MKLRNYILIILGAALMMPTFQSCKKGPNDPAISLKSRSSRLCGEWEISKAKITNTDGPDTDLYNYSDGTVTISYSGGASATGTYSWTYTIEKNGVFKSVRTETYSGTTNTYTIEGLWFFNDANKDADVKAKEMVLFQPQDYLISDGTSTTTYANEGSPLDAYLIDQLKSKEVVLIMSETQNDGTIRKDITELTLTQN